MNGKTAIVIGATGLVGRELVTQLLEDNDYAKVITFVRRTTGKHHSKLEEHLIDFSKSALWRDRVQGDVLFSALGTTRSQAGSVAAQRIVDFDYQLEVAKIAVQNGVEHYVLCSSVGADANSGNGYFKMKGELDLEVQKLGFQSVQILRPGPLKGLREKPRSMEAISLSILQLFNTVGLFKKYRPILGAEVAQAMRKVAFGYKKDIMVYEPEQIFEELKTI